MVATLEDENSGNRSFNFPTFVVLNVPLEVRHFCGAYLSLYGMTLLVPSLTNKRLPSEPLSHNTRKTLFAFLLCLFSGTVATMLVTIPVPLTTDCLKVLRFFSTILIGLVSESSCESHVIDFNFRTFYLDKHSDCRT